jgi:CPA2 family monovalent cation:H+ antiporter-2
MIADPLFFRDLAYVFVAAALGGALARLARQPLLLGYVAGGLLVSPLTPGPSVSAIHTFELFAEIGVILLMFSVGLEFSLRDLLRVRWVALLGGTAGILLCIGMGAGAGALLGWPLLQGAVLGMVVSVASTMVLARLLLDRGELHTRHGRVMVGITLVEDLAVVVLIILLPSLGAPAGGRLASIGLALLKAVAILVPFWLVASRLAPRLLGWVARARSPELFLLVALAVGLGTAALTQAFGLSLALGAFLAGLAISESDYAHETLARVLSLRDAFVALFFVTVGVLVDPRALWANVPLLLLVVALVVPGKLAVWTLVVPWFGYPWSTALRVAVGLTQIGEFSFILVSVARQAGHVGTDVYQVTLAASLLTILINAALVRLVPAWLERARRGRDARPGLPEAAGRGHVLLCGFGRVGSAVGEALETFGVPFVVVDIDPEVVGALRARRVPCVFGDAAQPGVLEAARAGQASLAVLALPEGRAGALAVHALRARSPDLPVLARAEAASAREALRHAGADGIVEPELEGAKALIRQALARLTLPPDRILAYLERFDDALEARPGVPPAVPDTLPQLADVVLGPGPPADQTLREAGVRERFGVTVVAIWRTDGRADVNPPPDALLREGDRVRVFGLPHQVAAFRAASRGDSGPGAADGPG